MKRFVVLIILIAFAAESYAGQRNGRWMMSQGEFEKDREECIESIDKNINSEAFGKALEECMAKKGYKYQPDQNVANNIGLRVYRQTEWMVMISQDKFENDRKNCINSIGTNLNSDAFGKALEDCLEKKGYVFKNVEGGQKPPSAGEIVLVIAGLIVLIPLAAVWIALVALPG